MTLTVPDIQVDQRILDQVDHRLIVKLNHRAAVVHVDDQIDFATRNGSLYVPGAEETSEDGLRFFQKFSPKRRVTTGCDHPPDDCSFIGHGGQWPPHCVRGTQGAQLIPGLANLPVLAHIKKGGTGKIASYGAVHDDVGNSNGLHEILEDAGIIKVFVYRLAFDFCVGETAIQLAHKGYVVYVVVDLTCAIGVKLTEGRYAGRNSNEVMIERLADAGVKLIFSTQVVET